MATNFTVNGKAASTDAPPRRPWVIREGSSSPAPSSLRHRHGVSPSEACRNRYCIPDLSAADLLKQKPKPTRAEIVEHMNTNICRCGTYQRIVRAVERAAREA